MDGNCDALLVERKQKQGRLRIMAELRVRIHIRTSAVSRSQGTMISELERVIYGRAQKVITPPSWHLSMIVEYPGDLPAPLESVQASCGRRGQTSYRHLDQRQG